MFLPVSGNSSSITTRVINEEADRNQNIDGQVHLSKSNPLIMGATLGGVLRLTLVSDLGHDSGLHKSLGRTILRRSQCSRPVRQEMRDHRQHRRR